MGAEAESASLGTQQDVLLDVLNNVSVSELVYDGCCVMWTQGKHGELS